MDIKTMKDLTPEVMMEYIEKNAPDFKDEFKEIALKKNKNGQIRYNSAAARHAFCLKFMPELLPPKKEKKPTATDLFKNW